MPKFDVLAAGEVNSDHAILTHPGLSAERKASDISDALLCETAIAFGEINVDEIAGRLGSRWEALTIKLKMHESESFRFLIKK